MNIYVGNLAFSATDHELRQLFEPYGAVDQINIITERDTGRARGFGFVDMPDSRAVQAAIQGLQGTALGAVPYDAPGPGVICHDLPTWIACTYEERQAVAKRHSQ